MALFLDVSAIPSSERWERFLDLIGLQQYGTLKAVWCVNEPGLGNKGFGHPDVVAVTVRFTDLTTSPGMSRMRGRAVGSLAWAAYIKSRSVAPA
jgi:hypothetical protein